MTDAIHFIESGTIMLIALAVMAAEFAGLLAMRRFFRVPADLIANLVSGASLAGLSGLALAGQAHWPVIVVLLTISLASHVWALRTRLDACGSA